MKLLFENWNKYLNEQNIMDKLAHLEDEGVIEAQQSQQIIDTARTLLIYEQMRDDIKALVDKLAHLEGEGKKDTVQQIIDTSRTLLIYKQMRDDIKALVDELIAFNREQFGSDAGKWAQKSAPEPDDADELEIY